MSNPGTAEKHLRLPQENERASTSDRASYATAENGLSEKDVKNDFDVYGDEDTAESTYRFYFIRKALFDCK